MALVLLLLVLASPLLPSICTRQAANWEHSADSSFVNWGHAVDSSSACRERSLRRSVRRCSSSIAVAVGLRFS